MSLLSAALIGVALIGASPEQPSGVSHVISESAPVCTEVSACSTAATPCAPACVNSQNSVCCSSACLPGGAACLCSGSSAYGSSGCHCQGKGHGNGWCPWGSDDDDCEPNCWNRHLLNYCVGPGNLHPHYPYLPIYHGYYYFRPYNHEHVFQASALAAQMGGEPMAPYSVEFLKPHFPPAPIEHPSVASTDERLPLLEDLLLPKIDNGPVIDE